ncbi:hypothetical protein ABES08_16880 [Peribacillus simplex]|uniref:hypothetical protein n=1 Tax=Peribacillus simplex TaxID=1478 RepID=UPI003D2DF5C9
MILLNAVKTNDALIKELQDKVISIQDHEISFLNDVIANIGWVIGIVFGIISLIFGGVGWMINRSNQEAQKKMEMAEGIIKEAKSSMDAFQEYRGELAEYRKDTEKEFRELATLVNSEDITILKENVKILSIVHEANKRLEKVEMTLEAAKKHWDRLEDNERIKLESLQLFLDYETCLRVMRAHQRKALSLTESSQGDILLVDCEKLEIESRDIYDKIRKLKLKLLIPSIDLSGKELSSKLQKIKLDIENKNHN